MAVVALIASGGGSSGGFLSVFDLLSVTPSPTGGAASGSAAVGFPVPLAVAGTSGADGAASTIERLALAVSPPAGFGAGSASLPSSALVVNAGGFSSGAAAVAMPVPLGASASQPGSAGSATLSQLLRVSPSPGAASGSASLTWRGSLATISSPGSTGGAATLTVPLPLASSSAVGPYRGNSFATLRTQAIAPTVAALGPIHADGGAIFALSGAPPRAAVLWVLTGHGALTPLSVQTDAAGTALALYNPAGGTPASGGDQITVEADVYA